MAIQVLIVDDEPLGRRALRRLLRPQSDFEIVGECGDGSTAVAHIRSLKPDVVFLDIQMPGMSGLEVVREIGAEEMPLVIFVTAFDSYAISAFEEGAVDYVLKPFDADRLGRALDRVRNRLENPAKATDVPNLVPLLERLATPLEYRDRFVVRVGQRLQVIEATEIEWIEAANNHVSLHIGGKTHLLRETMYTIAEMLNPDQFIRVHRSAIVNVSRVRTLEPWNYNEFVLQLTSGAKVTTGRTYREQIRRAFGC